MKTKLAILTLAAMVVVMGCSPQSPSSPTETPAVPEAPAVPSTPATNAPAVQP